MRSNFLSTASNLPATCAAAIRAAAARAGLSARAAVQMLRRPQRRMLYVAVTAAVVVVGLVAGLVAALVPSGPGGPAAAASDTAPVHQVASPAAGHAAVKQAITVQPGKAQAPKQAPAAKPAVTVQPGKAQAPKQTARQAPAAKPAPARKQPARQASAYSMYDSVTPSQIPGNHPIATYATGGYAVSPSQVSGKQVTWIDTNGSAPTKASVLDIEPGNVPPSAAAGWAKARLASNPHAVVRIYTMLSQWSAAKASIATLPGWMQTHVKWWIADPTGVQHVVPGSDATQWYWGPTYDISTVNPGF